MIENVRAWEEERRDNPRVRVSRPVVLNHARLGVEAGWIKDVSLDEIGRAHV